jgi:hypothetical protein
MLRNALSVTLCLMLCVSSTRAAGMLPPGKPAGVRRAQEASYGWVAIGALAVIAIAGYAISTPRYQIPGTATAATATQP